METKKFLEQLEPRITPTGAIDFPTLSLPDLGGYAGFHIDSPVAIDNYQSAGDFNGDGIGDLLILSESANSNKGAAYVVFGSAAGFAPDLNLASLNGANGFVINGEANGDLFGASGEVSDIDGNGRADLIIGAPGHDSGGSNAGAAYVIFGQTSPGASIVLAGLNGSNGFKIAGSSSGLGLGEGVAGGGDYNGDQIQDVLIGAPNADLDGTNSGTAYLVFGKSSGFSAVLSTASLDGSNGFRFGAGNNGMYFGRYVGFAGDLNNDGYSDIYAGESPYELGLRIDGREQDRGYFLLGRVTTPALVDVSSPLAGDRFILEDVGSLELGNYGFLLDVTGDGKDDFVTGGGFSSSGVTGGFSYIPGGKGTSIIDNPFVGGAGKVVNVFTPFSAGTTLFGSISDFNGDGYSDYVVDPIGDTSGNVYFGAQLKGTNYLGDGKLDKGLSIIGLNSQTHGLTFINDLNGDGSPELVVNAGDRTDGYIVFGTSLSLSPDGRVATYRDGDGDFVTIKTTKGTFDYTQFVFDTASEHGGRDLLNLKLSLAGPEFSDADISVTVRKGAIKGVSDGFVTIGKIDATGIDLGKVKIPGHLGEIDAGDANVQDIALVGLATKGFGRQSVGPAVESSEIRGAVGSVAVDGGFLGTAFRTGGGTSASVGSFKVSGDFSGELSVAGSLGGFSSRNFGDDSQLSSGAPTKSTKLGFREIGDNTVIDVAGAIMSLKATEIGNAAIRADSIASFIVSGDRKSGLGGGFSGQLILDNTEGGPKGPVLGKASISGLVQSASFFVSGSIGTFSAGAMETTLVFAGFVPSDLSNPFEGGEFETDSLIQSFAITGLVSAPNSGNHEALDSSFVVASRLGTAKIASFDRLDGSLEWGFGYSLSTGKIQSKAQGFLFDPKDGPVGSLDDFHVKMV